MGVSGCLNNISGKETPMQRYVIPSLLSVMLVTATLIADKIPATGGDIEITPLGHASVQIEHAGKVIVVDPVGSAFDLAKAKPADLVLITDIHGDHLDQKALPNVRKAGAPIVIPGEAKGQVADGTVIANGETKTVAGVTVEAVPMYNLQRGPSAGQLFHTKGRGNGYILTVGGKRIYLAGDTECTPEMKALKNIDVAFLPMNLPYTMTPAEAAECAKAFKPKVVYPYHSRDQKPEEFRDALKAEKAIEVRLLQWYPPAKPGAQ
jgi:L-ascorbate metabolism protein UlaG (beta-lactamase superfamily)